jgi:hypothetical protein
MASGDTNRMAPAGVRLQSRRRRRLRPGFMSGPDPYADIPDHAVPCLGDATLPVASKTRPLNGQEVRVQNLRSDRKAARHCVVMSAFGRLSRVPGGAQFQFANGGQVPDVALP